MKNSDMPAMPCDFNFDTDTGTTHEMFSGLTKREHFAGLAMQGILSNPSAVLQANSQSGFGWCNSDDEQLANLSLICADALLAELEKGCQNER
tara:strand:+ start:492 stop:770 length:279 start_codon:yes stop_codon:yes gene_type:complete